MHTEIEAKFVDINSHTIRESLRELGATCVYDERIMRRANYDYEDKRLERIGGWVRVRDEGDKVTLTYKQLIDRTVTGTKEIEVIVSSFTESRNILEAIGLVCKAYQETKREKWLYKGAEVTIDTWPWIPSFLEIEAESEDILKEVAQDLGLEYARAMHGSVETVYQMHYDFTEEEIWAWNEIVFTDEPRWLLAKKK